MTVMTASISLEVARVASKSDVVLPPLLTLIDTVKGFAGFSCSAAAAVSLSDACYHSGISQLCHGSSKSELFSFRVESFTGVVLWCLLSIFRF